MVVWSIRGVMKNLADVSDAPALAYVRSRIEGMEFELEQIDGIWYCWILEDKVYTFVGQSASREEVEEACKKHVHNLCVKGLTT